MKTNIAIIGAGRIGRVHAENIARLPNTKLVWVGDAFENAAKELGDLYGAKYSTDIDSVFSEQNVDAVLICSPTDTHADLLEKASKAELAIFCEKPIDLNVERVRACRKVVASNSKPVQLGFNRRFDPGHKELADAVRTGKVGKLQHLLIISRDPTPPPASYVEHSGGLFRDMMIHDFDMARYICSENPIVVNAIGNCVVAEEIGQKGDVDTATVTMEMPSGTIVTIINTRNCPYGYDQRIEAMGSDGSVSSNNVHTSAVSYTTAEKTNARAPVLDFFQTRYKEAYRIEIEHFIECVKNNKQPIVGFDDGAIALDIADAATQSAKVRQAVVLE